MADMSNKCAHPNCSCKATSNDKYCSDACRTGGSSQEGCSCGHPGCKASAQERSQGNKEKQIA